MVAQPQAPKKLKTLDDVDQALHELSWLDHTFDRVNAQCNQEIDALTKRQADRFLIDVDGEQTPIKVRRAAVEALIATWCDANLQANLPEGKKSLSIGHGDVGYRASRLAITLAEGETEDKVLEKLDRKTDFRHYIAELLTKLFGKHPLGMFVSFTASLSFSKILNAFKDQTVTEKTLNSFGLKVKEPEDKLFITPARYQVDVNSPS